MEKFSTALLSSSLFVHLVAVLKGGKEAATTRIRTPGAHGLGKNFIAQA